MLKLFVCLLMLNSILTYAQPPAEVTDQDLKLFEQEVEKAVQYLLEDLSTQKFSSEAHKKIVYEYEANTFRIFHLMVLKRRKDYSTMGMIDAANVAEAAYDKLLNKYYAILMNKLVEADKEVLRQTQRNWIKFRDSERNFSSLLSADLYTGGGSMHLVKVADYQLEITQKRVLELYTYLLRFYQ